MGHYTAINSDGVPCGHKHRTDRAAYKCMNQHRGVPSRGENLAVVRNEDAGEEVRYLSIWVQHAGGGYAAFVEEATARAILAKGRVDAYQTAHERPPGMG